MKFERTPPPKQYKHWRYYRRYTREDFRRFCAYCFRHEDEIGGPEHFVQDHFEPRSKNPSRARRRYFGAGDAGVLKAGQDAAARLAAAAGLAPVVASSGFIAQKETKYRKLTKSPLSKKQLDEFREILIAKRRLIIGEIGRAHV